jgi:hypothetical protein
MSSSSTLVPAGAILANWSERDWEESDGVQIDTREALDRILVRTYNSVYELIVQCATKGEILVRGGRFFHEFTRVHLAGSSLGGSFLKQLGIYVGLRMELVGDTGTIITSPVTSISFCPLEAASDRLSRH